MNNIAYGILGEHRSDANTLKVIVRRLACNPSLPIKAKGYGGFPKMFCKGATDLQAMKDLGCTRFIVCHDSDGHDPKRRLFDVDSKIVRPSGLASNCCVVIPVQELEAWILANVECATAIFTSWLPDPICNPEAIDSPKEYLEKLSRVHNGKPRYSHATHNEKVAQHLDLDRVATKCPSFRVLRDFVCGSCAG
jgi:hypothetical protein